MSSLTIIKQYFSNFIGKNEAYLKPVGKLLLSLIVFMTINGQLGYMKSINSAAIVLIAALMCSFMPMNFIVLISALFVVLHMYALSLETAIVVLVLFLVLFLLYFRLSPKDTICVVITPILTAMGIPYVMPVVMGLVGGPYSAASVGCGIIVGYVLKNIDANSQTIMSMDTDDMASKLRFIIDNILSDKFMVLLVIAFAITVITVYVISQLSIDYSWAIAIISGALIDAIIVLIANMSTKAGASILGLLFGTILAVIAGFVCQILFCDLDYTKTEKVQFEDDDYFYYVKAVPKKTAGMKKHKKAAARRPAPRQAARTRE